MNQDLSKIIDLLNSGNYEKAENETRLIYGKNPYSFDLNKILGLSLLAQRKYNLALKCFQRCYDKNENDFEILLNLSYLFTKIQFYDQSIKFANNAIKINPQHPGPYQNLSISYFHLSNYDEAKKNAETSISVCGGIEARGFYDVATELVGIYGDILLAQKKSRDFIDYAKKILNLTYNQNILIKLFREKPDEINEKHLSMINQVIEKSNNLNFKASRNTYLSGAYFFLAEYFSKTDKKKSEENYVKANAFIAEVQRESLFIRQKTAKEIYTFFNGFDSSDIVNKINPDKGKGIIFVLGMPRSGTTLTESVLSTADDIVAGGEKSFFSLQLQKIAVNLSKSENNLDFDFFEDLGNRYLENINLHRNGSKFFIDKLPENYLFYKFIKLCLPGAKFIHCHRDPWDNAISLFKQNYALTVFYASSFFGISLEYANHHHLMNFWKSIDGNDAFFEVKYEELVADTQRIANQLWDFCNLSGVYSEEKRQKHKGYTASFQQVTKEIYSSSIKKTDFIEFKDKFLEDLRNQEVFWNNLTH